MSYMVRSHPRNRKDRLHTAKRSPASADLDMSLLSTRLSPTQVLRADVSTLQRVIGNRSVVRLLQNTKHIGVESNVVQPDSDGSRTDAEVHNMEPLRVTGDRGGSIANTVPNLDRLRGQGRDPNEPEMSHDDETVARNSPNPNQRLPFTNTGWRSTDIMTRLGQYDTIAGTDSDSKRCVQAVAMASQIQGGPDAVVGYLNSMVFEGLLSRSISNRQRTAIRVIELVKSRIVSRRATYGDLSWAQEAIHDLFYNDFSGTPEADIKQQIAPTLDVTSRNTETLNIWCTRPSEVIAETNKLPPGGQLILATWTVVFNSGFDQVEEQGYRARDRMQVRVNDRLVWIRRINTDRRPNPRDIQQTRDSRSGHQLLLIKDNGQLGTLRLYEPETTRSGQHLITISPSGAELMRYLTDNPAYGIYDYIQIIGRVTPISSSPSVLGRQ